VVEICHFLYLRPVAYNNSLYNAQAVITACTLYKLLYKPLALGIGNGWQILTSQITKTFQPILTKLETYNYHLKTTRHARPHIAASTWVVWVNTQFATGSFFPCLIFLSFFFLIPSARAQVAPVDRSAPNLTCKCGFRQGCAFWGSQ